MTGSAEALSTPTPGDAELLGYQHEVGLDLREAVVCVREMRGDRLLAVRSRNGALSVVFERTSMQLQIDVAPSLSDVLLHCGVKTILVSLGQRPAQLVWP